MEQYLLFLIIGLVVGLLLGYLYSLSRNRAALESMQAEHVREKENGRMLQAELFDTKQKLQDLQHSLQRNMTDLATVTERGAQTERVLQERTTALERAQQEKAALQSENLQLEKANTATRAQNAMLQEKLSTFKEELAREFEVLSGKILEDKSKRFTLANREQMQQILTPFEKEIKEFKEKVNETYLNETRERHSLQGEIKKLIELNQQLSNEAKNLTKALTADSKTQGDWGELILENILERSGLEKGREFEVQGSMTDLEGNRLRPDVVVKLPDDRSIIIDSKVSLTDYDRFIKAEEKAEQERFLQQHLRSVKKHVDELKQKNYTDYPGSPEYIFMFIPIEPAFFAAMQADPDLWHYAYNKGIIIIGPTNLIAALKLVSEVWKKDKQNRNAMEIAERAGNLYDKFVSFADSLSDIGKNLEKAGESYQKAMGQLRDGKGNLVGRIETLRKLGAKNKKHLDQQLLPEPDDLFDDQDDESE